MKQAHVQITNFENWQIKLDIKEVRKGILCFVLGVHSVSGLLCSFCNEALDVGQCKQVSCGTGEQCFLEVLTRSSDGKTVYNGGCRSEPVCRASIALLGKRSSPQKRDVLHCVNCCNTAPDSTGPCNAKLCGISHLQTPPICLSCNAVSSAGACLTRQMCQETQVCGNEIIILGGSLVRYNYYCEDKHLCAVGYKSLENHGRRKRTSSNTGHSGAVSGVVICNSCCIGDECNKDDCYTLQKRYNSTDFLPVSTSG